MAAKTQTIDAWLKTHADHQPDQIALSFNRTDWSYLALSKWVEELSGHLQHDLDLKRGDRIAYFGKNSDVQIALMFAAARLGLIFVPLNWRLDPAELNFVLADCDPRVLFLTAEFKPSLADVLKDLPIRPILADATLGQGPNSTAANINAELSDPFLIVYTSGTTGRPKGAVITQDAVLWNALMSIHAHDFTPADHTLNLLPLFHVGGINIQMMPTFFVGGRVTLHAGFDPDLALSALGNDGITTTVCVPTVMKALLAHPKWPEAKMPKLRLINTGSTDVPVEILEAVHARGIPMVQTYGTTETGPIATYQKLEESLQTIGSIGRCGAHTQASVRRDDGSPCDTNEPGEIWVKGPNNFTQYWNDPEASQRAISDGWFKTGDIAYRDDDGLFWFSGRSKHVIISGGENIYPAELERILNAQPGVLEACVVGRPDPKWGEVPVAVIVTSTQGPDRQTVLSAFDGKIARYKHPKDVIFLDALPKNALGKILIDDVKKRVTPKD
jgi:fatty-acyl-CoA synthase